MEPIKQTTSNGVEGFFSGLGKGLIGAVVKPAVGVFDLYSRTTEGIQNTPQSLITGNIVKRRPPRYIPPNRTLIPYSKYESEGQDIFYTLEGAKLDQNYITHIQPLYDNARVFISNLLILHTNKLNMVTWGIKFEILGNVQIKSDKIPYISLYIGQEINDKTAKKIYCISEEQAIDVKEKIEKAWDHWKKKDLLL